MLNYQAEKTHLRFIVELHAIKKFEITSLIASNMMKLKIIASSTITWLFRDRVNLGDFSPPVQFRASLISVLFVKFLINGDEVVNVSTTFTVSRSVLFSNPFVV